MTWRVSARKERLRYAVGMRFPFAVPIVALLAAACSSSSTSGPPVPSPTADGGDAAAGDTWDSYASGFFTTYCVECHGAGNPKRDFTTPADVRRDEALIRCGVAPTLLSGCSGTPAPKQFPISNAAGTNPKPSDADRTRLVAWLEGGAR